MRSENAHRFGKFESGKHGQRAERHQHDRADHANGRDEVAAARVARECSLAGLAFAGRNRSARAAPNGLHVGHKAPFAGSVLQTSRRRLRARDRPFDPGAARHAFNG
jgi:hypothetical protein